MPNQGDVVSYKFQGTARKAIVLHAHSAQVSHLGANGEPMLHLAFIAPERESERARRNPGYIPEIFIEHDVVHTSHTFSDEFKRDKGLYTPAQIATQRGAGEWEELPDASDAAFAALLNDNARLRNELSVRDAAITQLAEAERAALKEVAQLKQERTEAGGDTPQESAS